MNKIIGVGVMRKWEKIHEKLKKPHIGKKDGHHQITSSLFYVSS